MIRLRAFAMASSTIRDGRESKQSLGSSFDVRLRSDAHRGGPPLGVTFARLLARAVRRIQSGEELWPGTGNRETFRKHFRSRETLFWWALKTYRRRRRRGSSRVPSTRILSFTVFRSPKEAQAWLDRQPATAGL